MNRAPHCKTPQSGRLLGALALTVLCSCIPSVATADAGTPLMWAGFYHLTLGNLVIGLVEGGILAAVFQTPPKKTLLLMVGANYFSMLVGIPIALFVTHLMSGPDLTVEGAWRIVKWGFAISYMATLVLEWPFIAGALRGRKHWLRSSIAGSFLVQTLSYAALLGIYLNVSSYSLYTGLKTVDLSEIKWPQNVSFYYIDDADGDVMHWAPGRAPQRVADLHSGKSGDRLELHPSGTNPERWDIVGCLESRDARGGHETTTTTLVRNIGRAGHSPITSTWFGRYRWGENMYGQWHGGPVPRIGSAAESPWTIRTYPWPGTIVGSRGAGPPRVRERSFEFASETPFHTWMVYNATHLPGDLVLLQLGADRICVVDPIERKIAMLVHGRGPAAAIDLLAEKDVPATTSSSPRQPNP